VPNIKLLHFGDIHFDRKFSNLGKDKADIRNNETILTFKKALERFSDADIVLIPGDLFDGDCTPETVRIICNVFKSYPEMNFFISCGNHDCLGSPATKLMKSNLPGNVFLFGETIEKVALNNLGACVYGISFSASNSYTSLINGFSPDNNNYINIMCMHADMSANSKYNPITNSEIALSNLDYLALGHIHSFSGFKKQGSTVFAYPGVLEPGGFDETGKCGVIYGEISKENINLDFYPVSKREYIVKDIDVSAFHSDKELISYLHDIIIKDNFYKINFVGEKGSLKLNFSVLNEIICPFYIEFAHVPVTIVFRLNSIQINVLISVHS